MGKGGFSKVAENMTSAFLFLMCKWFKEDFMGDIKRKRIVTETETIPGDKSKQLTDDIIVHAYVTHFSEHQNLKTDPCQ